MKMKKYFITQIYFTENEKRNDELKKVIDFHKTSEFDKIYYLNEKIYGYECDKIKEINIEKRLTYNDIFDFVKSENLEGVIFFGNSDIYFNKTIHNVPEEIYKIPIMYCQLRVEHTKDNKIKLDTKTTLYKKGHSQDVWIYHSTYNEKLINSADFFFGVLGCDNCFNHIAYKAGFRLVNSPRLIHCIHLHNINYRIWKSNNIPRLNLDYTYVIPNSNNNRREIISKLKHHDIKISK